MQDIEDYTGLRDTIPLNMNLKSRCSNTFYGYSYDKFVPTSDLMCDITPLDHILVSMKLYSKVRHCVAHYNYIPGSQTLISDHLALTYEF